MHELLVLTSMFTQPRKGFFEKVLCVSAVGLAAFLPLLTGCSHSLQQTTPAGTALPKQWVVGWGASPEDATESIGNPGGSDQTFRFIILPTIDGTEERIHFSNLLSKQPVTIGAARLAAAVGVGPSIDATRDAALTFNGSTSVTLAVGQEVVSDPVKITYTYGEKLAVSAYVKGVFPPLDRTQRRGPEQLCISRKRRRHHNRCERCCLYKQQHCLVVHADRNGRVRLLSGNSGYLWKLICRWPQFELWQYE